MHSTKILTISVVFISFAAWTSTVWAVPMIINNQATFNTAVTNAGITLTTDGFEDLGMGLLPSPATRPGYTITETGGTMNFLIQTGGFVIDGTRSLTTSASDDPTLFTFAAPINAFSVLLGDIDFDSTGNDLTFAINGGTPLSSGINSGENLTLFLGILDTSTPFTTVNIDRTGPSDLYEIDLVRFGTLSSTPNPMPMPMPMPGPDQTPGPEPPTIPEPSTMLLLSSGLAGLAWLRHRKSAVK